MDPKYYAEEVIGRPNHHLKTWLDASGMCLLNTLVVSRIYLSYEIPQLTKPTSKGPLTFQGWNIDWWNRNQVKSEVSHHDLAEKKSDIYFIWLVGGCKPIPKTYWLVKSNPPQR